MAMSFFNNGRLFIMLNCLCRWINSQVVGNPLDRDRISPNDSISFCSMYRQVPSDYTEFSFDMSWLDGGDRYSCSILAK